MSTDVLSSKWAGLSPRLLATIYPVDNAGAPLPDDTSVVAPLTESNLDITANWQSPFEQSGPESKIPAIMAMLQSGALQSYAETLLGKASPGDQSIAARLSREVVEFAQEGAGRTGMTKLNSTQVFTGSPPVKISLTMRFRAFDDPAAEVQAPVDQLIRWALARKLAKNGNIVEAIQQFQQGQGFLKALLPSQAPQLVALLYGGYTFSPMVIENISNPLVVPRTKDGEPLQATVQMTLATLTALDEGDWRRARAGRPAQLFTQG